MSIEEYSLKFSMLSRYAPPLCLIRRMKWVICDGCRRSSEGRMSYNVLHDYMTLARLMVYVQSIEESKLWRMDTCFNGVLQMIKTKLGLTRGLKCKMNLRLLRWSWRKEVVPKRSNLLLLIVVRNIMVSVYWVRGVSLVVVRNDRRWQIVLWLLPREKRIIKLLLMFWRMILQQRGVSLHFCLQGIRRKRVMTMLVSSLYLNFNISSF